MSIYIFKGITELEMRAHQYLHSKKVKNLMVHNKIDHLNDI